jgi:hypothetical protein
VQPLERFFLALRLKPIVKVLNGHTSSHWCSVNNADGTALMTLVKVSKVVFLLLAVLLNGFATAASKQPDFNPTHIRILTSAKRNELFTIWARGERCGKVTRTFFQGQSQDGTAFWSVQCSNGVGYSVAVHNDDGGSTKIMECGLMKRVTKVDCFDKFLN